MSSLFKIQRLVVFILKYFFIPSLLLVRIHSPAFGQTDPEITYTSYLGGDGFDGIYDMAICADSTVVVIGLTGSSDFPGADGAASNFDIFVSKISIPDNLEETGQVFWTVLLGGSSAEREWMAVEVGDDGMIYVAGTIVSSDFQEVNSIYTGGGTDGILAVLDADGNVLIASRIGGNEFDTASAIELDVAGNIYLTGWTNSDDFSGGALDRMDAWVLKLSRSGNVITEENLFFYGGSDNDFPFGIAVDPQGKVHLTGHTSSNDLPLKDASDGIYGGIGGDLFFAVFNTDNSLETASYWGGSSYEESEGISLDNQGNFYIWGTTSSNDLTTIDPIQSDYGGSGDGIIVVLDSLGKSVISSTYLGGSSFEHIFGGFVDEAGNMMASGISYSQDFLAISPINAETKSSNIFAQQQDRTTGFWAWFLYKLVEGRLQPQKLEDIEEARLPGGQNAEVELRSLAIDAARGVLIASGFIYEGLIETTANALQNSEPGSGDGVVVAIKAEELAKPKAALTVTVEQLNDAIVSHFTSFKMTIENTGEVDLNEVELVFEGRKDQIGFLRIGEKKEFTDSLYFREGGFSTIIKITGFGQDPDGKLVTSNFIDLDVNILSASQMWHIVNARKRLASGQPEKVDVYVDDNRVVDDSEPTTSTPVPNTELSSITPKVEVVTDSDPDNSKPIATFQPDLTREDSTLAESSVMVLMDAPNDSITAVFMKESRLVAQNPNQTDFVIFHAVPNQPQLTVTFPGDGVTEQMLNFGEFTDYLSIPSELHTIQIQDEQFDVDLRTRAGEALTMIIVPDSSQSEPDFSLVVFDTSGVSISVSPITSVEEQSKAIPREFTLFQNYPNPFNPETTIRYNLPEAANVRLKVFDITGKLVTRLVDKSQQPGKYSATWNGRSGDGLEVASGVYFYEITAGSFRKVAKMLFIK